ADEGHGGAELADEDVNGVTHARFAGGGQTIEMGAADEDCSCAEGERGGDVGAAADSGIDQNLDLVAHRVDDGGKHIHGRGHVIELAPAVIGNDDRVDANVGCVSSVVGGQDALERQRPVPCLPDPIEVVPGQ